MLPPYIVLEKEIGQTPLQAIDAWRRAHPEHKDVPATYAGRLDPMATGRLLVLLGDECKNQERYRNLDKEYEIEVLLDFSTDTGDVLGMPTYTSIETSPNENDLRTSINAEVGVHTVPYPAFSSKTVNGKPLFLYSLEGTLDTISIPVHEETIHRIVLEESQKIEIADLRKRVLNILSHAPRTEEVSKERGADFRQDAIRAAWSTSLSEINARTFLVLRLRVVCGSGTYMRSLADRIGRALGTQGIVLSIHRTRMGRYRALFGMGFWTKAY